MTIGYNYPGCFLQLGFFVITLYFCPKKCCADERNCFAKILLCERISRDLGNNDFLAEN